MRAMKSAPNGLRWTTVARPVALAATLLVATGCSRNPIEAVNLANEGDQVKGTNPEEAISKYEQAIQLDPSNHRILYKLILVLKKKEDWAKMASAAAKAEKAAPTYANYSYLRGYALARAAEKGPTGWAEAKEPLQDAIKKDPNLADAYFDLAEVLLHLDDESGALANYTKAIEVKPDELSFYGPLADLYTRLGYLDQAEQVAKEALNFAKPGDKALFAIHSILGDLYERKGNVTGAIAEYEAAKQACGQCQETLRGEQLAYFNLGAAYASATPPKTEQAMGQLTAFHKVVCKGGLSARYADQCAQAQEIARKLGGQLN